MARAIHITDAVGVRDAHFWRHAILAGIIGGAVFMIAEMLLVMLIGESPWAPPRMIAALVLGTSVLPSQGAPATFDGGILLAAMLAWHLVRSDMIAARLVFALNSASTSLMTQVTLTDIRRIAQEQVRNGRERPRWHDRPDIWSRLIQTARSSHSDTFDGVTTRGLQLFLQEFLADERDA